jgi:methanogenic corrinoid protein MtbC1
MRDDSRQKPTAGERRLDVQALTRAIEDDVIPRLARRHRLEAELARTPPPPAAEDGPSEAEVIRFADQVVDGRADLIDATVASLRQRGCTVETIFLQLLKPAARRLGELWCDDRIDFTENTLAVGRLQRLMRELSPAFAAEREAAAQAHRALFVQAPGEQHSFGLSMLAEFFRRAGWDVLGGVGGTVVDAIDRVRREWVDLVGFSVGSEPQLARLADPIAGVRAASLNPRVVVMVGGPLFADRPDLLASTGADTGAVDANQALHHAERLVAERQAGN